MGATSSLAQIGLLAPTLVDTRDDSTFTVLLACRIQSLVDKHPIYSAAQCLTTPSVARHLHEGPPRVDFAYPRLERAIMSEAPYDF